MMCTNWKVRRLLEAEAIETALCRLSVGVGHLQSTRTVLGRNINDFLPRAAREIVAGFQAIVFARDHFNLKSKAVARQLTGIDFKKSTRVFGIGASKKFLQVGEIITVKITGTVARERSEISQFPIIRQGITIRIVVHHRGIWAPGSWNREIGDGPKAVRQPTLRYVGLLWSKN